MSYLGLSYRRNKQNRFAQDSLKKRAWRKYFSTGLVEWNIFRFQIVAVLFCIAWGSLWFRAGYIQLWEGRELAEKARRQHISLETVATPRRSIIDRNGRILAKSIECYSVYANPCKVEDIQNTARKLSGYFGSSEEHFSKLLNKSGQFVWIARRIDDATAVAIRESRLPGIMLIREYERVYPHKHTAGQLLGFVGVDGSGLEGIEYSFNDYLSSVVTKQIVWRDASGRRFYVNNAEVTDIGSGDLQLTLDLQIQSIAENAVAQMVESVGAKWGGAIVIDVTCGEVLAWSQYPFFNPNAYRQYKPCEYRNRLALDALEPGSTFKPFLVAAALQEGVVTKDTVFDCEDGLWKIKNIVIRDDGTPQKELSVSKILSHSSNIGCGKIALELGAQKFYHYLSNLGFGQPSGIQLIEGKGILRRPRDWSETDLISTAFGQSLSATTLQLMQGFLTLANHGVYKPIKLFLNGASVPTKGSRIFSENISQEVLEMMHDVVESGTGRRAAIPGVSIAGKTGTAQKADKTGKYGQERIASFVGLFPVEDPKYLVLVVIDEPSTKKYGGVIAAPVFRNIATRVMAYHGSLPGSGCQVAKKEKSESHEKQEVASILSNKRIQQVVSTDSVAHTSIAATSVEVRKKIQVKSSVESIHILNIPDVIGKSIRNAVEILAGQGFVPEIKGNGFVVVKQEPEAGTSMPKQDVDGKKCILWLSER